MMILDEGLELLIIVAILKFVGKFVIMGKAIVKLNIATYAGEEYVVTVDCEKDDIDELIIAKAWQQAKDEEHGSLPYGPRKATILKRME